jgi:nucleoside-diphosphate-sugar epimerase
MTKTLIVGGAGYVGGYMTDAAIQAGHQVRVIDNLTYEDGFLKDVDFYFGNILDISSLRKHLDWADCVIWLAAFVGDPACAINPKATLQTNVESIRNLINNFEGRIIFPSTCSVYGVQKALLDESSRTNPLSLYAESKLEAESVLIKSKNSTLIFRLGTLFGLSDTYSRLRVDLVLNALTIRATLEESMSVFGGAQYRPLLHVRDVATAFIPQVNTTNEGIYNLHDENVTILELAQRIQKIVPNSSIEMTEISFQDARNYQVSSDKARQNLGFAPKWSVEDGISEIHNTIVSKRIKNVANPRFNNSETLKITLGSING